MQAIEIREVGGPEVLTPVERPDPVPGDGEILVDLAAAGVNFIDLYRREGRYPLPLPAVPGEEGSGRVLAVVAPQGRTTQEFGSSVYIA